MPSEERENKSVVVFLFIRERYSEKNGALNGYFFTKLKKNGMF